MFSTALSPRYFKMSEVYEEKHLIKELHWTKRRGKEVLVRWTFLDKFSQQACKRNTSMISLRFRFERLSIKCPSARLSSVGDFEVDWPSRWAPRHKANDDRGPSSLKYFKFRVCSYLRQHRELPSFLLWGKAGWQAPHLLTRKSRFSKLSRKITSLTCALDEEILKISTNSSDTRNARKVRQISSSTFW